MPQIVHIQNFLMLAKNIPIIDVRSEGEYQRGHIPGAINLPLFSNEERKTVGTIYRREGRERAIEEGLAIVSPKLLSIVKKAKEIAGPERTVALHCWRGGMRSNSVGWLLETCGFKTHILQGGYKAYRRYVQAFFHTPLNLIVLGGYTGSGKTAILHALARQGEQIIDLEMLAHHKGSAFGSLGEKEQPTVEMYENLLFSELKKLDLSRTVWIEDESRNIGKIILPAAFYEQKKQSPTLFIEVNVERRINYLLEEYGRFPAEELRTCIDKIKKRLGFDHYQRAIDALNKRDLRTVCITVLKYYDKSYRYLIQQRPPHLVQMIDIPDTLPENKIAGYLLEKVRTWKILS